MATALLDELYFLLAVPLVALAVGWGAFLPEAAPWLEGSVAAIFIGGSVQATLATLLSTALFGHLNAFMASLKQALSWGWMRRWRKAGLKLAEDLLCASATFARCPLAQGVGFGATFVSWTARFMTLNALTMARLSPHFQQRWNGRTSTFGRANCPCGPS